MPRLSQPITFLLPACSLFALATVASAQGGSRGAKNPFSAPDAFIHYAPDRMYDLQNLLLEFNVDYPNRTFYAIATNSIAALRDGTTQLQFNANPYLKIDSVELNGQSAHYTRTGEDVWVDCPATKAGEKDTVVFKYHGAKADAPDGNTSGWHWHEPVKNDPSKVGLWTNGETSDTRDWAITWDYPNDFTTSETRTTIPKDWEVISNGTLMSDKINSDGKTRTVTWKMTDMHATYLTSLVCGPFTIHKDDWRGMPVYYVCPKGKEDRLDYTVEHTKDMLSFYSDNLGVRYPWSKYAEDFTYDFGGGQENVSNTTFGLFFTDPRDGDHTQDWILAHEMGHQWFGDYVSCKDWGQIWLNESFATFMEMSYILHEDGVYASQREMEQNSTGYFTESRRYERPQETNFYSNPGVMFDQHTYPKGGVMLMMLRNQLGNKVFYAGLKRYLETYHNGPVETSMLCNAMTDATGINMHPWFDQWIEKPGHPIIDWSWSYDDAKHMVAMHVKQTQDTSKGTPIYDIPAQMATVASDGTVSRSPIHLNAADQTFEISAPTKPATVLFDPDHLFLREIKTYPWAAEELPYVAQYAPNGVERQWAYNQMLAGTPGDAVVQAAVNSLKNDQDVFPAIVRSEALAKLKREDLRAFWESELKHKNFVRRSVAVGALAMLQNNPAENARLISLINDKDPYDVVAEAIRSMSKVDFDGAKAAIKEQARTSKNSQVRGAALTALLEHGDSDGSTFLFESLGEMQPDEIQQAGIAALPAFKGDDPRLVTALRNALNSGNFNMIFPAINAASSRKIKDLIPDLQAVKAKYSFAAETVDAAIAAINK